jgi:hypothetical protein
MKDERIRYRASEREVVVTHGVKAFCLTNGNLRATEMAATYLVVIEQIAEACLVNRTLHLRRVPLWHSPRRAVSAASDVKT